MTKQCAYFAKGKEYQEAQQAAASGPPKPINCTRRQPTTATTPYHYTPVKYGIPSQHQPQQYPTFTNYNPCYRHYNAYDNPQSSFSYNNRYNNQPYMVHSPTHSTSNAKLAPSLTTTTANPTTTATSKTRARKPTQSNNNQQPNLNLWCDTCNNWRIQRGSRK